MNIKLSLIELLKHLRKDDLIISSSLEISNFILKYFDIKKQFVILKTSRIILPFSIAVATGCPRQRVFVIQDSKDYLLSIENIPIIKEIGITNLVHIVFNSEQDYEYNLKKTSLNLGYTYSYLVNNEESIEPVMRWVSEKNDGCSFIEFFVKLPIGKGWFGELEEYQILPYENVKMFSLELERIRREE